MGYKIIFVVAYALAIWSVSGEEELIIKGAPKEIDIKSPEVVKLTDFILTKLNEGAGENKKTLVEVIKATSQVVSGSLTTITLKLAEGGSEKLCEVAVWEQPWLDKTEITSVKCGDELQSADA